MGNKLCEICGKQSAKYVCQECGRDVCEVCLEPDLWLCSECYKRVEQVPKVEAEKNLPYNLPFMKVFLLGFVLMFMGMVILMVAALVSGLSDSFGFFLLIGFIPIVFGAGQYSYLLVMLGIALTILSLVVFIVLRKQKLSQEI